MQITLPLRVNGQAVEVSAMADTPLLLILRNDLRLNGPSTAAAWASAAPARC